MWPLVMVLTWPLPWLSAALRNSPPTAAHHRRGVGRHSPQPASPTSAPGTAGYGPSLPCHGSDGGDGHPTTTGEVATAPPSAHGAPPPAITARRTPRSCCRDLAQSDTGPWPVHRALLGARPEHHGNGHILLRRQISFNPMQIYKYPTDLRLYPSCTCEHSPSLAHGSQLWVSAHKPTKNTARCTHRHLPPGHVTQTGLPPMRSLLLELKPASKPSSEALPRSSPRNHT